MKKGKFILPLLITIIATGCSPAKNVFVKSGNNSDDAIQIAISDFTKVRKLYKPGAVFSVNMDELPNHEDLMVVGNKGAASGYPKGAVIPPTKVEIKRPEK